MLKPWVNVEDIQSRLLLQCETTMCIFLSLDPSGGNDFACQRPPHSLSSLQLTHLHLLCTSEDIDLSVFSDAIASGVVHH